MARYKEKMRRWFFAIPLKFWAECTAVVCLCCVLGSLFCVMRVVEVQTSDGETAQVVAPKATPHYVLSLTNIAAMPEDVLTYRTTGDDSVLLEVERSFPVTVQVDGQAVEARTVALPVREALGRLGVTLGPDDYTEPALQTILSEQSKNITVHRVSYRYYDVDEPVPYETEYQYTSLFYRSQDRKMVMQQGKDGYRKAEVRDRIVDGKVEETQVISALRDEAPQNEILKVYKEGAPVSEIEAPAGITVENNVPSSYTTVLTDIRATGYYSPRGRGASGLGLYYGTFAVDPTLIPYGTKVYITSADGRFVYGWAIATDTGGFIHTNRMQVDLFYETYEESAINAVQTVNVYIP